MPVETKAAAPAVSVLDALEDAAWRIPLSTRRLFLAVSVVVVSAIIASSLAAAWVASRNSDTIARARETGLDTASAATEFRTSLAAADARAASTLISGGLEDPESRRAYGTDLRAASRALTDAALVATDEEDADDIEELADGLVRYTGLVETARANSRQGFPVGAAYLNQARALARDELVPTADHLRRIGEQRVARAANSVGGPIGAVAVVVLVLALAVLVGSAAVAAGRSRRLLHPAVLAATVAVIAALVVVTSGITAQSRELRAAATTDIDAYVAANDAAFTVSNLRVTEISAVASRGSGAPQYEEFRTSADTLLTRLGDDGPSPVRSDAQEAVRQYVAAVAEVERIDSEGDNRQAAVNTLEGASFEAFQAADQATGADLEAAVTALGDRFTAASDAAVNPLVPLALGVAAAGLAGAGTLARARRYR